MRKLLVLAAAVSLALAVSCSQGTADHADFELQSEIRSLRETNKTLAAKLVSQEMSIDALKQLINSCDQRIDKGDVAFSY